MYSPPILRQTPDHNQYVLTSSGHWVRDFTRQVTPLDINELIHPRDYKLLYENELANISCRLAKIDAETMFTPNVIILSDGYDYGKRQQLLEVLSNNKDVTLIATNRALANWRGKLRIDYYVCNNPYPQCQGFLPKFNYFPRCVVSTRVHPAFVRRYLGRRGVVYRYVPTPTAQFAGIRDEYRYTVDDYRNPICAAVNLAYHWDVQRLLLFCCDDAFGQPRPAAISLDNGLWMYPQQQTSHGLIDGCLYWLKRQDVQIADFSSGPAYSNAETLRDSEIVEFFST